MAWRYCNHCGAGQDRLTLDEIGMSGGMLVNCSHCGKPRQDDTMAERTEVLASEIAALGITLDVIRDLVQHAVTKLETFIAQYEQEK